MESDDVSQLIAGDVALAHRLGVTGTPSVVLNGRLVPEICQSAVFWRAIASVRTEQPVLLSDQEVPAW